jgi:hypothetical protein
MTVLLATSLTYTNNPLYRLVNLTQERTMSRFNLRDFDLSSCRFHAIDHVLLPSCRNRQIVFTKEVARWDSLPSRSRGFCSECCVRVRL